MKRGRLTDAEVLAIYRSDEEGIELAAKHGVHKTVITSIRRGKIYKHVTGGTPRPKLRKKPKVTAEQVRDIRRRAATVRPKLLAREHRISVSYCRAIIYNHVRKEAA